MAHSFNDIKLVVMVDWVWPFKQMHLVFDHKHCQGGSFACKLYVQGLPTLFGSSTKQSVQNIQKGSYSPSHITN